MKEPCGIDTPDTVIDNIGLTLIGLVSLLYCLYGNIFAKLHANTNGSRQLEYACELGLGSLEYNLLAV